MSGIQKARDPERYGNWRGPLLEGLKQKGPEFNERVYHSMALESWASEGPIPIVPWKLIVMISASVRVLEGPVYRGSLIWKGENMNEPVI